LDGAGGDRAVGGLRLLGVGVWLSCGWGWGWVGWLVWCLWGGAWRVA
jgi:hypothetical protein